MKEHIQFIHSPSTKEIFYCISSNPKWVKLLIGKQKEYEPFLINLVQKDFYKDLTERPSIKSISVYLKYPSFKVTKWLGQAYSDIFELNSEKPELFKTDGIKHNLYFRHYDSGAFLTIWLKSTPAYTG